MLVGTDYSSTGSLASSAVRSNSGTASSLLGTGTATSGVSGLQQDTYTPGGSVNSASAYQRSGRAWTRPTLSEDQLQAKRSMEHRRAQERHALAVKKSAMYTPGPAVPLPVTAPGSVPVPVVPVVAAAAAGAAAADALAKKDETKAEAPKEETKPQEPPQQQQAAQEKGEDGNILTDAAGAVWDGTKAVGGLVVDGVQGVGTALYDVGGAVLSVPLSVGEGVLSGAGTAVGLIALPAATAVEGAAYFGANGSLSPVVGAGVIADGASSAASAIAAQAPAVIQGAQQLGPQLVQLNQNMANLTAALNKTSTPP